MIQIDSTDIKKQKKLALTWAITFLILFPVLITLGLLMRLRQGEVTEAAPSEFFSYMTLHGLGMAGVLFSFAFAALWYLNSTRYVKLNVKFGWFLYIIIAIGVVGLLIGTLIGKFGPGWYMLYPLPFKGTFWPLWATKLSVISLIILGVGWLVGILHILYALAKEYGGITNLLGWQYLKKDNSNIREIPSMVLITTISLIPGVFALIIGAAMLIMYLLQSFEPSLAFDPLMMKNMVMFFGHTLVNITMYCAVGWVYALLPEFTHREWKVNKAVVYSWNATFFFILFAYLHHLYMDFVQPTSLQYLGQIISYSSAIPATGITMFGVIAQVYHAKMKWSIIPLMFLFGMAGWAIGGFAAVVDSTIALNSSLHNTLWVPAHFHTYMLMGVVLFILGFLYYLFSGNNKEEKDSFGNAGFWIFVLGSYGFLLMFYLGGLNSVPRRYSNYSGIEIDHVRETGVHLAQCAALFVGVLLIGLILMYLSLICRLVQQKATNKKND
ncbi:MAG: cbb3-type cytochrome c oxidase subunit I [Chitinophagaceae bacterium]|nr:cbb3-type cytochrome c oxidase subunit I [Chitinophagaceae bacterium]MCW5904357.1 cbb3-type cytochrome c oxidase subunit I [Chitinophagaceae bacterium]